MPQVTHVVGTRPNFVKAAPVIRACAELGLRQRVVHTGQHYDERLSGSIIADVGMQKPDIFLGIGSGSHAAQTARGLDALEVDFCAHQPSLVCTYGDVNSSVAAALVASKLTIPVAHIESGLRSFDSRMPEEQNRKIIDVLSALHFTTEASAGSNLEAEGHSQESISFVGNTMIDTLEWTRDKWEQTVPHARPGTSDFCLVTVHRPSNTDDPNRLHNIFSELELLAQHFPVIVAAHPRLEISMRRMGLEFSGRNKLMTPALGYWEMLSMVASAGAVITDSGGLQEEASYLGIPCHTVRDNTERPVTVSHGTNKLVEIDLLSSTVLRRFGLRTPVQIPLWDGLAAKRVAAEIFRFLEAL